MTDAAPRADAGSAVLEYDLDERPETVWRALTTPEIVAEWLGPNTMTHETGRPFEIMLAPEDGGVVACEVLEASPPERLSYAWRVRNGQRPDPIHMEVTFTLTPTARGGTHLRIEHGGPALRQTSRQGSPVMSSARAAPERRPRLSNARPVGLRVSRLRSTAAHRPLRLRQAA